MSSGWLSKMVRQDAWLVQYGLRRKIFEARAERNNWTILDVLEKQAEKHPNINLLMKKEEKVTYREMVNEMNRRGQMFHHELGVKHNTKYSLFMNNNTEFVKNWFGGVSLGACAAFINNNLRQKQLMHCLTLSDSEFVIVDGVDANLEAIFESREAILAAGMRILVDHPDCQLPSGDFERLPDLLAAHDDDPVPAEWGRAETQHTDPVCLIFTSGTTGLPKAAPVTHKHTMKTVNMKIGLQMKPGDVQYSALPLYHSFAALIGISGSIMAGSTLAITDKFSASNFWKDCYECNAKYIAYIGEMMRYIIDAPPNAYDKKHNVQIAIGSGLRYDIWPQVKPRFGDMWLWELYASTEGNIQLANIMDDEGCIMRFTPFVQLATGGRLLKFDPIEEKLILNSKGRAIKADYDEPGLLVGKIRDDIPFNGYYKDEKKTEEKILRNVFSEGDAYFNSGDLLKMASDYTIRFVDRVGDTFRWKGENVSTLEVSNTLGENIGWIQETNVYGIKVSWAEGACGAAAIVLKSGVATLSDTEKKELFDCVTKNMPFYQRPIFIRIQPEMEKTGTFKHRKVELVREGYDFEQFEEKDALYFYSKAQETYIQMTAEMVQQIDDGVLQF